MCKRGQRLTLTKGFDGSLIGNSGKFIGKSNDECISVNSNSIDSVDFQAKNVVEDDETQVDLFRDLND